MFNNFVKRCIFGGAREKGFTLVERWQKCSDTVRMATERCCPKQLQEKKEERPAGSLGNTVNGYNGYKTVTKGLQKGYKMVTKGLQSDFRNISAAPIVATRLHNGCKSYLRRACWL